MQNLRSFVRVFVVAVFAAGLSGCFEFLQPKNANPPPPPVMGDRPLPVTPTADGTSANGEGPRPLPTEDGVPGNNFTSAGVRIWRVSFTLKSFIPDAFGLGFAGRPEQQARAADFANLLKAALNPSDVVSDEREDKKYRLFSRGNIAFSCDVNKISIPVNYDIPWNRQSGTVPDDNTDVGREVDIKIPYTGSPVIQFGPANGSLLENALTRIDDSQYHFRWTYIGRPAPEAESGFRYVTEGANGALLAPSATYPDRPAVYIWHVIDGVLSCKDGKGYWTARITGSAFPAHRAFFFTTDMGSLDPQDIDNLWLAQPGNIVPGGGGNTLSPGLVTQRSISPKDIWVSGLAR